MTTSHTEEFDPTPRFTQSLNALMSRADEQTVASGLLATMAAAPFGGGILRDGTDFTDTVTQRQWEGICQALEASALPHAAIQAFAPVLPEAGAFDEGGVVPIGLVHVNYQQPTRRLMARIMRAQQEDAAIEMPAGPLLETRIAFAACAELPASYWGFERQADVHHGLDVSFHLDPARFISTQGMPDRIELDFDDGLGLREVPIDGRQTIHYDDSGQRRVLLQAQYGARTLKAAFLFHAQAVVQAPAAAEPQASEPVVFTVKASVAHQGIFRHCRVVVHLGKGHTRITKPFVLAEGFPGGTRPQDLYDRINGKVDQNRTNPDARLADELRAKGFDLALIFFGDGGSQIQGNAYAYLAALQELWKRMGSTGSIVAAGGSMGGLIARYALAYAETHSVPTGNITALMTFDSPHQGANVPLAIQCVSRYYAPRGGDATNRILDLPAARQMLIAQRWEWEGPEGWEKPDHIDFYKALNVLGANGYPSRIKKYAVSNGAGTGDPGVGPRKPGAYCRYGPWDAPCAQAEADAAPNGAIGTIARCVAHVVRSRGANYIVLSTELYGRDGCSGGTASFFHDMAVAFRDQKFGVWVPSPLSCFVPTHSALGVAVTNAYTFKADDLKPGQTPFDAWYTSRTNDPHATIDKPIKEWVLAMIA